MTNSTDQNTMMIVIKRWADFSGNRWVCIGWFIYHFAIFCLVVINFAFLYCHFHDYTFTPTDTSALLLTFVGFLFAFAGINIYSIFNTNVEAEKHSLQKLRQQYEEKLSDSLKSVEFSKSLVRIYILVRLIVEPQKADSQYFDNIDSVHKLLTETKDSLVARKNELPTSQYEMYEIELKDIASGVKVQISSLKERIHRDRTSYFVEFTSQRMITDAVAKLDGLYNLLEAFEDGSIYEEPEVIEEETPKPLKSRIADLLKALVRVFNPKYGR